jgi:DtxR family Mn-dependent transcriptional regulator
VTDVGQRVFSQSVEDYLKAIYKLQADGCAASTTGLARHLGTTPAAATKMMKNLAELHLIDYTPYQGVRLTTAGTRVALEVIRHHRLLELYLHEALGYDWAEVDAEAEKLEHHISEEFEARIERLLNYPAVDPHGEPIPARDGSIAPLRGDPLADSEPGDSLVVRRVRDGRPEALRLLTRLGLRIGAELTVVDKQPLNGPLTVDVGGQRHSVGRELAGYVFVEFAAVGEPEAAV